MDKDQVIKESIEYSGLFDFPNLYSFLHSVLKKGRYGIDETKYSEKKSANVRDLEIEWICTRELSDYVRAEHKIRIKVSGLSDVEVEIEGQKRMMNKGKIEIEITGNLITDPDYRWEGSSTGRFFKNVYETFKGIDKNHAKEFIGREVKTIKEEVKAYLEMLGIL